jgi:hypothetical protein
MQYLTPVFIILAAGATGLSPTSHTDSGAKPMTPSTLHAKTVHYAAGTITPPAHKAFQQLPKSYLIAALDLRAGNKQIYIDPFGKPIEGLSSTQPNLSPISVGANRPSFSKAAR